MSIKIITDTGSDITPVEALKMDITLLPLKTVFGEEEFLDGIELTHDAFFEKLIECDTLPKTSQVTPAQYEEAFKNAFADSTTLDNAIICITLSSKLSGCYQSANIAKDSSFVPLYIVDSLNVCIGQRLLVELAVKLRDEGKTAFEIVDTLNKVKSKVKVIALLDTLEYLKKGGRISPAVAVACDLLSIKPVIAIENGEVALLGKARGSKAGNNKLNELVEQSGGIDFNYPICLAYSGLDDKLLRKYAKDSEALYTEYKGDLPSYSIGSAIGTHIGPGAIATSFFSK